MVGASEDYGELENMPCLKASKCNMFKKQFKNPFYHLLDAQSAIYLLLVEKGEHMDSVPFATE